MIRPIPYTTENAFLADTTLGALEQEFRTTVKYWLLTNIPENT
jgi:hypothetical protein